MADLAKLNDVSSDNVANIFGITKVNIAKFNGVNILNGPTAWDIYVTTDASPQTIGVFTTYADGFVIDWGDDSGPETKIGGTSSPTEHTHSYSTAGNYTIKLSGSCERIYFYTATNSTKIKGFGKLGGLTGKSDTSEISLSDCFRGCSGLNMANISEYPFEFVGNRINNLTRFIFSTGLSGALPSKLFGGISYNGLCSIISACEALSGLTSIPADLFYGSKGLILGSGTSAGTRGIFHGCTGLTSIPSGLFTPVTDSPDWTGIFRSCTGLNMAIPTDLFDHLDGVATHVDYMFNGCTNLPGQSYKFWNWSTPPSNTTLCYGSCTNLTDYATIPAGYK